MSDNCSSFNIIDELKHLSLDEVKNIQKRESLPFAVSALNLDGSLNLGMMIRTAVIFGAQKFYVVGKKRYDKRSTVGAHNYIDIQFVEEDLQTNDSQQRVLEKINNEYIPVLIEQGGSDIMCENFYGWSPCCFMFGSESAGTPEYLQKSINHIFSISQIGILRSLNVSAAAAIVIHKVAMDLRPMPREYR